jgi:two-component system, LytTR family, response regulator
MSITCIAIDDEPLAMEKLLSYIGQIPDLTCIGSFTNCIEAMAQLGRLRPDILFLDIQMEPVTGIQMLEAAIIKPYVVIISAYDNYAIKGFELNVADYILKPYSLARLLKSVEKFRTSASLPIPAQEDRGKDFIFVKTDYRIIKLVISDIYYIEGMRDYLCLHSKNGKILTQLNFADILDILPQRQFARVHKSYAVNLTHINSIEKHRIYINNQILPISETYRQIFYSRISQ